MFGRSKREALLAQQLDDLQWSICKGDHNWVDNNRVVGGDRSGELYYELKCTKCGKTKVSHSIID